MESHQQKAYTKLILTQRGSDIPIPGLPWVPLGPSVVEGFSKPHSHSGTATAYLEPCGPAQACSTWASSDHCAFFSSFGLSPSGSLSCPSPSESLVPPRLGPGSCGKLLVSFAAGHFWEAVCIPFCPALCLWGSGECGGESGCFMPL